MKVKNTAIYVGGDERILRHRQEEAAQEQKSRKNISAAQLSEQGSSIFMKKQQAQKKAMKIVGDTFAAEHELDKNQDVQREHVKELAEEINHLKGLMSEQKENNIPEEELTAEMKADYDKKLQEYQKKIDASEEELKGEIASIRGTKIERLKSSPMLKAQGEADKILEAASDEITGMLWEEAKDHIEEEQKKKEEQAEKIAEKKEEEEARLEEAKEGREEQEAMIEVISKSGSEDVKKEIDELLEKLKLIEEDLKGAAVDTQL